jgi:hypothetical protein
VSQQACLIDERSNRGKPKVFRGSAHKHIDMICAMNEQTGCESRHETSEKVGGMNQNGYQRADYFCSGENYKG